MAYVALGQKYSALSKTVKSLILHIEYKRHINSTNAASPKTAQYCWCGGRIWAE